MNSFNSFINNKIEFTPYLSLCHTCDANTFKKILETSKMLANSSFSYNSESVVDNNNLYLFYGRPAYRINKPKEPSKIASYYPVCFILDTDKIGPIKRVFPFDTGAYFIDNSTYSRFFHKDRKLSEFELESDIKIPAKVVSAFYGDNNKYYLGEPIENLSIPVSDFEANEYYDLIRYKGIAESDDRIATVELQIGNDITINDNNLIHIIVPASFKGDDYFFEKLTVGWGLADNDISTYPTYSGAPNSYFSVIFSKTQDFYKSKGLL